MDNLTVREARIVKFLINNATRSTMQSRHAAGLVQGGSILEVGINSKREFVNGNQVSSTHAEMSAIFRGLRRSSKLKNKGRLFGKDRLMGNKNRYRWTSSRKQAVLSLFNGYETTWD